MKLSKNTLETLKNFSQIYAGVVLIPGQLQSTISPEQTIFVEATIEETIPTTVPIYDLPAFLGILSQLDAPDIDFQGDTSQAIITDTDGTSINYLYSEASLIKTKPSGKSLSLVSVDASFDLTKAALSKIIKIANSMSLPDVTIVGNTGKIYVRVSDKEVDTSNSATKEVGVFTGEDFEVSLKIENLVLIPDDYRVEFSKKQFATFVSSTRSYVIAITKSKEK